MAAITGTNSEANRQRLVEALARGRAVPAASGFTVHRQWPLSGGGGTWTRASIVAESGESSQARLPFLLSLPANSISAATTSDQRGGVPLVFVLHGTTRAKSHSEVTAAMERYAARGWAALSFDLRYHGERSGISSMTDGDYEASGAWEADLSPQELSAAYQQALVGAWRGGSGMGSGEHPFVFDSAWDLARLVDWCCLEGRVWGVDPNRLGATGISLGGMVAWIAAAADPRITVVAPAIGVQGFQWAIDHGCFGARVATLQPLFDAASADRAAASGSSESNGGIDGDLVAAVWDKIVPGLRGEFDAPASLPLLSPRPLLLVQGGRDPRCPIEGVRAALDAAHGAYRRDCGGDEAVAQRRLALFEDPAAAHEVTPRMWQSIDEWFEAHL